MKTRVRVKDCQKLFFISSSAYNSVNVIQTRYNRYPDLLIGQYKIATRLAKKYMDRTLSGEDKRWLSVDNNVQWLFYFIQKLGEVKVYGMKVRDTLRFSYDHANIMLTLQVIKRSGTGLPSQDSANPPHESIVINYASSFTMNRTITNN